MNFTTSHLAIAASLVSGLALFGQKANAPFAPSPSLQPTAERQWPVAEGTVMLPNFKFGDGNSLPALRLHYLTLGKPHRNAAGRTDNVVLLLHGTGGDSHSLLSPVSQAYCLALERFSTSINIF